MAQMGMAHRFRGTPEEGIALVQPMLEVLAWSGPTPALASLHLALASLNFLVGKYQETREAAERAGEIARAIGDQRLLGEAEERRGLALIVLGQPDEALQIFREVIPLIQTGGDLLVLWLALNNTSVACNRLGQIEESRRYTEQALIVAERIGNPDQTAFILGNLGSILLTLGDWKGAGEYLERAMTLLGDERMVRATGPLRYLGQLAMLEGRWEEAVQWLEEALTVCQRTGDRQALEETQASLAELDVLSGQPEAAIRRLEEVAALEGVGPSVPSTLAWALVEAGALGRAAEVVTGVIQRARAGQRRFELLDALRVQGMRLRLLGQLADADHFLEEGLVLARSLPHPYAEARILVQMGLLERQHGNLQGAGERLKEALAIFRRLGAAKDVERTEQALAGDV
jgi:tetratricopeptide (TPR) repeat protein